MSRRGGAILLPILAVVAAMAAFQIGGAFAKGLFPVVGPPGAATLRLVIGAVIMLAFTRPWRVPPQGRSWLPILGLGAAIAASMLMFYQALSRLPLGVTIALQFLGPLTLAILGSRRPVDLIWAALAGLGVWALVGIGFDAAKLDPIGVGWALGAGAGWAAYILFGRAAGSTGGAASAALATLVAAIIVTPLGWHHAGTQLLSLALLPAAMILGLFTSAIPISLEIYAMPRMPTRTYAVFMSLEPVFGALSGLIILGERLTLNQSGGVLCVVIAAAGSAWSARAASRAE